MFQSSLVSPSFTCASYRGSAPKMRLKQDPFYTRYGGTHVFLEPSDAMFDLKPFCPVPSFTRRKKVNRVYRRNRAGRKLIVGMFYNVVVGEEAVIIGEEAVEQEAGVPEAVVLGEGPEVLGDEDQVVEEVLLDEGDEADLLASLLEAKGAAGSPK